MRPPDWPERLAAHVAAARARPWAKGAHDCATFVCDAVLAIGGPDLGRGWRGLYEDEDGSDALIRARGRNLEEALAAELPALGLEEVPVALAGRGDVVVLHHRRLPEMVPGVLDSGGALVLSHQGVVTVPRRWAVRAWRVG